MKPLLSSIGSRGDVQPLLALALELRALGHTPVAGVARHITTDHPWLAADPVLAPVGTPIEMTIWQTGAWLFADPTPLPEDLERFLAAGDPPLYFGFGRAGCWRGRPGDGGADRRSTG